MGDRRFAYPYHSVRRARDAVTATALLTDDEVIQALAHASRERDPYLANVLASEAMNRMHRARIVFEHLGEGVCLLNAEGVIRAMNPAAMRRLGWSPDDVARALPHEALHAHPGVLCCVCRARDAQCSQESERDEFATRSGATFPVWAVVAPVFVEGACEGYVLAFRDLSERRAAEAERVSWTTLIEAFYHLHDKIGIGLVVTEGPRLYYANDAFRAMVARSLEELKQEPDLLSLVAAEERAQMAVAFIDPEASPWRPVRAHLLAKDGKRLAVDLYVTIAGSSQAPAPRYVCLVQRATNGVPLRP